MDTSALGKILLILGIAVAVVGLLLAIGVRLPFGSLPGDVSINSGNASFNFPIVTCIVLSIVLTVVINVVLRR